MGTAPGGAKIQKDFYGRTEAEALAKYRAWIRDNPTGPPDAGRIQSLNSLLAVYLDQIVKPKRAQSTYESYCDTIRLHVHDSIGRASLLELERDPARYQTWLNALAATGIGRTATYAHAIIRAAMGRGVRWGYLDRNVAAMADVPEYTKKRAQAWKLPQARAFLLSLQGHRLAPLYFLALTLGLRRGELMGLRWDCLDWEAATLEIRASIDKAGREGDTKTDAGERLIFLDAGTLRALRDHRDRLRTESHREGWRPDGLIFPSEAGTPLVARNLYRHFKGTIAAYNRAEAKAAEEAGRQPLLLPVIRFHDLRHTALTLLRADAKAKQSIAGHADVSMTLGTYVHEDEEAIRSAVAELRGRLQETKAPKPRPAGRRRAR